MAKTVAITCATSTRARYYLFSAAPVFVFVSKQKFPGVDKCCYFGVFVCVLFSCVCLQVVYFAACVGVVLNPVTNTQRFFQGHSDDIQCLTLHPDMQTVQLMSVEIRGICDACCSVSLFCMWILSQVATAQKDPKGKEAPCVCIWDGLSMKELVKIEYHERGICCLDFSPDGKLLVTMGLDDNHTVAVWNWMKDSLEPVPFQF
jgi:hypothetical protein